MLLLKNNNNKKDFSMEISVLSEKLFFIQMMLRRKIFTQFQSPGLMSARTVWPGVTVSPFTTPGAKAKRERDEYSILGVPK